VPQVDVAAADDLDRDAAKDPVRARAKQTRELAAVEAQADFVLLDADAVDHGRNSSPSCQHSAVSFQPAAISLAES
jgi:hypothetical protein